MLNLTRLINTKTGTIHLSDNNVTPVCVVPSVDVILALEPTDEHCRPTCKRCIKEIDNLFYAHDYEEEYLKQQAMMFEPFNEQRHSF